MGLFSRRKQLGEMQFSFPKRGQVAIVDTVPDGPELIYHVWFAFLTAAKLLHNFPDGSGQSVLDLGVEGLSRVVAGLERGDGSADGSVLGICTGEPYEIVQSASSAPIVYRSELFQRRQDLFVQTHIAHGDEDHYHRATIDAVFEQARLRLGSAGSAIPEFELAFFQNLEETGCSDIRHNTAMAMSTAAICEGELTVTN